MDQEQYSNYCPHVNSYVIENELWIDVDDVKDAGETIYGGNVFGRTGGPVRHQDPAPPIWSASHYSARIREVIAEKGIAVTLVQWYDEPKERRTCGVVHSPGMVSGSPPRRHRHSAKLAWLCANGKLAIGEPLSTGSIVDAPAIGAVKGVGESSRTEYLTGDHRTARITGFIVFADNDACGRLLFRLMLRQAEGRMG